MMKRVSGKGTGGADPESAASGTSGVLTERDERDLAAYLDDELTREERSSLERRLLNVTEVGSNGRSVAAESEEYLTLLRGLRRDVALWSREQTNVSAADAERRSTELWRRIETSITAELSRESQTFGRGIAQLVARMFSSSSRSPRRIPDISSGGSGRRLLTARSIAVGGSIAAVAYLFTLSQSDHRPFSAGDQSIASARNSVFPGTGEPRGATESVRRAAADESQLIEQNVDPMILAGAGKDDDGEFRIEDVPLSEMRLSTDILARAGIDTIPADSLQPVSQDSLDVPQELVARLMPPSHLPQDDREINGGFRAGGVDIAWIRSDNDFRLVSSNRASAPPVVWVSRSAGHHR